MHVHEHAYIFSFQEWTIVPWAFRAGGRGGVVTLDRPYRLMRRGEVYIWVLSP